MARVKTFTNGGGFLPGDLNAIQDDYEYAFSTYKTLLRRCAQFNGVAGVGATYGLATNGQATTAAGVPQGAMADMVFWLDPADRVANGGQAGAFNRTAKYRLRAEVLVGSTAVGGNLLFTLQKASAWGTTTAPQTSGFSTVGSTTTVLAATAVANSQTVQVTTDFTIATAGWYWLGVTPSATTSSVFNVSTELQYRQV